MPETSSEVLSASLRATLPPSPEATANAPHRLQARVAVIWIDWYAYHVARLEGLLSHAALAGHTVGIELVGGIGVHAGLKFREELPPELPIETLMPDTAWREASHWKLARMLWKRLDELDPEVVLVPGYYTLPAVAAALWARVHSAASVLMTESTSYDHIRTSWKERAKSAGLRLLFGWAVTGGRAHVDYLRQLGFPAGRIAGFYDVVNNDLFAQGTARMRASSSASAHGLPASPYFLYVGRLAEEKNVAGLLGAWLDYRQAGGTWPLVLVGDGPEASMLRALAETSRFATDVHFPGLRSSHELLPFYAFAGCFVLPSTREPWGLVVNEAMASGLPVLVSSRCGCAPDLVAAGINGFTFDPEDGDAVTSLLSRMEKLSHAQRTRMGDESARIINDYSPASFGRSIASILSAVDRRGCSLPPLAEASR